MSYGTIEKTQHTPKGCCLYCKNPMIVHEGQIKFFHKGCRKEGRILLSKKRRYETKKLTKK